MSTTVLPTARMGHPALIVDGALNALHAPRIAAEEETDLIIGTIALMNPHFLAASL